MGFKKEFVWVTQVYLSRRTRRQSRAAPIIRSVSCSDGRPLE